MRIRRSVHWVLCWARTGNGDVFQGKSRRLELEPMRKMREKRGSSSNRCWEGLGMGLGVELSFTVAAKSVIKVIM